MEKKKYITKPLIKQGVPAEQEPVNKSKILVTSKAIDVEELPALLKKKLFVIRPKILSAEFCYNPCWWVELDFHVTFISKKNKHSGTLHFVVDEVKGCGVIEERLDFKPGKKAVDEKMVIPRKLTREQAEKKAVTDARWKVVFTKYKNPPLVDVKEVKEFYRPYYKVKCTFGKDIEEQMIPADDFANYYVLN